MPKRIYIMDGTQFAYRAFYAFINKPLKNSAGMITSAPFGMINSLLKIIESERPDAFVVAFDKGKPAERIALYPEYKSTRQKMPEDLKSSLPFIRRLVDAMNIPVLEREGVEADDLIGTLAKRAEKAGWQVVLVTGDKDFMQLVNENISILAPSKGALPTEWFTAENAAERFGIPPSRMIDYLAIVGDSSDNIPGVKGIGKVGALKIINQFKNLDEIFANLDKIGGSTAAKLAESREMAYLSHKLATIDTDLDLDFDWEGAEVGAPNYPELLELLRELEFTSLLARFTEQAGNTVAEPAEAIPANYSLVASIEQLNSLCERLRTAGRISIDTETTDERPMFAELVGISLCATEGEAFYIPIGHNRPGELFQDASLNLPKTTTLEALRPILDDSGVKKLGQNIKYDLIVLKRHGLSIRGLAGDAMIADYLLTPGAYEHGLDALALRHLGHKMMTFKELTATDCGSCSIAEVAPQSVAIYSGEDADFALRLTNLLEPRLDEAALRPLYDSIEIPLIPVLADMEMTGIRLDSAFLKNLSVELKGRLDYIEREIYRLAGRQFNIASPKQLAEILFEKLGLPSQKKTKTGYSTDITVLQSLAQSHELPAMVIQYRELTKLIGTYIDTLPALVNPSTGRIHPTFQQAVASTGRLSCRDPNLQNIPVRGEIGREIRKAFIPAEGNLILSADYSQIELRVMAHLSGDENLIAAFHEGKDVHASTASRIFGVPEAEVTRDQRRMAKVINFGVIYGMTAWGVGDRLDIDFSKARNFIDAYFERFPGVAKYMKESAALAEERGFVETILGRRRYFPELKAGGQSKKLAERAAINTPIQGSAADIIKIAMLNIHAKLYEEGLSAKMVSTVHDELVFDVPKAELEAVKNAVRETMESAASLRVPLVVDIGAGENWFDAHE